MPKRKTVRVTPRPRAAAGPAVQPVLEASVPVVGGGGAETTGRFIVVFKDAAATDTAAVRTVLSRAAGLRHVAASSDFEAGAVSAAALGGEEAIHFQRLGIAVVSGIETVQGLTSAAAAGDSPVLAVEPEYIARLSNDRPSGLSLEYLRGYRDAVNKLYEEALAGTAVTGHAGLAAVGFEDTARFTWGLQASGVSTSPVSGQGIKVAVLDTGFDLQHPDFRGRDITAETFTGVPVQDVHGHGTHCVGTACGPQHPASGVRRYGVAFGTQIFVGKVFDNAPRPGAPTSSVIAGLEWAVTNGCRIVSLSLGAPVDQKIQQYETPIRRAFQAGTLIVAAAGNNANRSGLPGFDPDRPATFGFVEPPANADDAMAVAALDNRLRIAVFSARSSRATGDGGIVNIAGPGVAVFSSVPESLGRHALFSGTSMATPHVAGLAALWAQASGLSGAALWKQLVQSVRPLDIPSVDVGAGLAQAPQ